jgi:hypothetical protein
MTDVLFVYCKLNEDISYRQGMHELLAPIFLVLNTDYIDAGDMVGPTEYVHINGYMGCQIAMFILNAIFTVLPPNFWPKY